MILEALGVLAAGGLAYGLLKSDGGEKTESKGQVFSDGSIEEIKSVNKKFDCRLSCKNVRVFNSPNYETKYQINGKEYDNRYIPDENWVTIEKPDGIDCDLVLFLEKDQYGNKVVKLVRDIPCFDSGDREYDSCHSLKFFHNAGKVHSLYCGEGYRIAKLVLFENVTQLSENLKDFLREKDFPF